MGVYSFFLNILFPERCVGCGRSRTLLCDVCLSHISPALSPKDEYISAVYAYRDGRIRKLIHILKYKNARKVSKILAPAMAGVILEYIGEEEKFVSKSGTIALVPVPLHKRKKRKRGYNQAEELAREIMRVLPEGVSEVRTDILKKHVDTIPQARLRNRRERLENPEGLFTALPATVRPSAIFIIDDVSTTGATLRACKKALRDAGYTKIHAVVAAH